MIKNLVRSLLETLNKVQQSWFSLAYVVLSSHCNTLPKPTSGRSECLVLGNGPSLSADLGGRPEVLHGRDVLCVNNFVFSDSYEQFTPSHYVVLDPYYWAEEMPEQLSCERREFFSLLERKTRWPVRLYVPFQCKGSKVWARFGDFKNPDIKICFFNRTPIDGFAWLRHFLYRLNLGMPWAQNVLVAATFLAINLGYKRLFLLGADHSWHEEIRIGRDNRLYLRQLRCYDSDTSHLEPVYKGNMKELFTMSELFEAWAKVFRGHVLIEEYARHIGAKVYNASSKSFIDAFERVEIDSLAAASEPQGLLL